MVVADLTHAYHATSGGIRTYIDAKREYILAHTEHTHVLVVPGERTGVTTGDRWATYTVRSPVVPFAAPYRFFVRPGLVGTALGVARPDVVELNSLYSEPWQAFDYRRRSGAIVSGYFFTDLAHAYVGAPVSRIAGARVGRLTERIAGRYVRRVFERCDLRLAPSAPQAGRLASLGVDDVYVVTPGVDLDAFHPSLRDSAPVRAAYDLPAGALLAVYAGRLDGEKHPDVLVEAIREVNRTRPAVLLMAGQGPAREALEARQADGDPIRVLPYLNKPSLARLLASSDVYVTAGPHETFALSVVEAQAAGLPVVGVAAGALLERVPAGLGYLGPVGDAPVMAQHLLAAADAREAMGQAARRHVETTLSWRSTFDRLFGLYEEALRSR